MTDLTILRGLSGSGKTAMAREWVQEHPERRVRIGRDSIRSMVRGNTAKTVFSHKGEQFITQLQRAAVIAAWEAGKSVILDDTNLRLKFAREWAELAEKHGKTWAVIDVATPVDDCLVNNAFRPIAEQVPPEVIMDQARRFPGPWPVVEVKDARSEQFEEYDHLADFDLPEAFIFDIDGTLALNTGGRSYYDESRVLEDEPNYAVLDMLITLKRAGHKIILMSGRSDACRHLTISWLYMHLGADMFDALHMRGEGDQRKDYIVKGELFDKHVRHNYSVAGVYDDRAQVIEGLWRAIGLQTYQVARNDN